MMSDSGSAPDAEFVSVSTVPDNTEPKEECNSDVQATNSDASAEEDVIQTILDEAKAERAESAAEADNNDSMVPSTLGLVGITPTDENDPNQPACTYFRMLAFLDRVEPFTPMGSITFNMLTQFYQLLMEKDAVNVIGMIIARPTQYNDAEKKLIDTLPSDVNRFLPFKADEDGVAETPEAASIRRSLMAKFCLVDSKQCNPKEFWKVLEPGRVDPMFYPMLPPDVIGRIKKSSKDMTEMSTASNYTSNAALFTTSTADIDDHQLAQMPVYSRIKHSIASILLPYVLSVFSRSNQASPNDVCDVVKAFLSACPKETLKILHSISAVIPPAAHKLMPQLHPATHYHVLCSMLFYVNNPSVRDCLISLISCTRDARDAGTMLIYSEPGLWCWGANNVLRKSGDAPPPKPGFFRRRLSSITGRKKKSSAPSFSPDVANIAVNSSTHVDEQSNILEHLDLSSNTTSSDGMSTMSFDCFYLLMMELIFTKRVQSHVASATILDVLGDLLYACRATPQAAPLCRATLASKTFTEKLMNVVLSLNIGKNSLQYIDAAIPNGDKPQAISRPVAEISRSFDDEHSPDILRVEQSSLNVIPESEVLVTKPKKPLINASPDDCLSFIRHVLHISRSPSCNVVDTEIRNHTVVNELHLYRPRMIECYIAYVNSLGNIVVDYVTQTTPDVTAPVSPSPSSPSPSSPPLRKVSLNRKKAGLPRFSLGYVRLNLLEILFELSVDLPMAILPEWPDRLWSNLVNWLFDSPSNTQYQQLLYKILELVLRSRLPDINRKLFVDAGLVHRCIQVVRGLYGAQYTEGEGIADVTPGLYLTELRAPCLFLLNKISDYMSDGDHLPHAAYTSGCGTMDLSTGYTGPGGLYGPSISPGAGLPDNVIRKMIRDDTEWDTFIGLLSFVNARTDTLRLAPRATINYDMHIPVQEFM